MSKSHMPNIRALLRKHTDGLTLAQLSDHLGVPPEIVNNSVRRMPDAYIDRWEPVPRGQYASVWCVVTPPPNCPHPTRKEKA